MADPWQVPEAAAGERIDRIISLVTGLSRSEATALIEAGRVRVSGRVVSSRSARVQAGQRVELAGDTAPPTPGLEADPSVEVPVVWYDDQIVVVDKPAGMVVHPGAGNRTGTLVQGLLARFAGLGALGASGGDWDEAGQDRTEAERPGVVHRLDKGTSGLLVVALTPAARDSLTRQLAERSMGREYLSLVSGSVNADAGVIDAPLGRSASDPTRFRVQAGGRWARTHYEVLHRAGAPVPATLIRCRLETGRTHQIRVHLSSIGHPVIGDHRYGPAATGWQPLPQGRCFLHAALLSLRHPVTDEQMVFTSPLPEDLRSVAEQLRPPFSDPPPG